MRKFTVEELQMIAREVFHAAGFPLQEAEIIAEVMSKANLVGHDSHGVIQIPRYVDRIQKGEIFPGVPVEVIHETPSTAILDGHSTLGYIAATRAMRLAMEKAQQKEVSSVGVCNLDHIGRVGTYPEMAAEAGMVSIVTCNAAGTWRSVVPFGGREPRFATNPIAIAAPTRRGWPILLDMATSTVAAAKVRIFQNQKKATGDGWIVDKEGKPTNNPGDLFAGGALLPLGGNQGHKGYGLAFMIEILSGILARSGTAAIQRTQLSNGTFMIVIDINAFLPMEKFLDEIEALIDYMKATPPAPGFSEVLVPGEFEARTAQERRENGIMVDPETWRQILAVLDGYKIAAKVPHGRET